MNKKVFMIIGPSILLLGIALACNLGGPKQAQPGVTEPAGPIVSMTVASSLDEQGQVVDPAFTFSPDQPKITVIVQVGEVSALPLEIVWYWVTEETEEQLFVHTVEVAAFERAYSVGLNPGTLAAGTYRAVATLGDQTQEIEWDVAGEQQEMVTTVNIVEPAPGQPPTAGPSGTMSQTSSPVSEPGSSDLQPGAFFGPGNWPPIDLQGEYVEIYPHFGYYNVPVEIPPAGLPPFRAEYQAFMFGRQVHVYTGLFQGTEAEAQTPYVIYPCPASDLPGTQVKTVAGVITEENGQSNVTQEKVITLGDDTLAPRVGVISTPARGAKVMPGEQIVLTVTATEKRSGGPWQMGVERIQVIGPEGLVDSEDYQDYRGKACDAKSWEQTFEVTYTVPENPLPQIELCAIGEDFAGNTYSRCGTFYTVDVWEGTMHSESSESGILNCTEIWDMKLVFTISEDGTIEGAGKGNLVGQQNCYSSVLPDHDFSDLAVSLAFNVQGSADRNKLNLQLGLFDVQGGGFNGLLNYSLFGGESNAPAMLGIPITTPGIAGSTVTITGSAGNGETYSGIHTLDLKCGNCKK